MLAAYLALGADPKALGLRLRPLPNGRYWMPAFILLGGCALALIGFTAVACWFSKVPIRSQFSSLDEIIWFATGACMHAPVTEELFYRMALCAPLVARIGPRATILISSLVFGYLHVRWGNFHLLQVLAGAIFCVELLAKRVFVDSDPACTRSAIALCWSSTLPFSISAVEATSRWTRQRATTLGKGNATRTLRRCSRLVSDAAFQQEFSEYQNMPG